MVSYLHLNLQPWVVGVDVSCTKKGDSFRGDKANRQQVNLRLMDMVEMAEAHELGKPHWAASEVRGWAHAFVLRPTYLLVGGVRNASKHTIQPQKEQEPRFFIFYFQKSSSL